MPVMGAIWIIMMVLFVVTWPLTFVIGCSNPLLANAWSLSDWYDYQIRNSYP